MTTIELVISVIVFIIAGVWLLLGIISFTERGLILNNGYLLATEEERKTMDKAPYYRQTAIVFFLITVEFIIIGLYVVFHNILILLPGIPVMIALIVYVIVSTVKIKKRSKK